MSEPLVIASSGATQLGILPALANRHGLITGATGTGKTVSLQVLAERFSSVGVPVFMADVKGDLAGLAQAGTMSAKLKDRLEKLKLPQPTFDGFPVTFWDVYGESGHPLRATISDLGPLLLSRMLGLNETQEGVLHLVFKIADERGLLLLDAKDLRAMLQYIGENASDFTTEYGNVSAASIGAIQRGMLTLSEQGGDQFFGEPMLNLDDLMQTDSKGRGVINILSADRLLNAPRLYASFLLWMLSELFENLPEVGDRDKPRLVFFFDEAHILFNEAPKPLLAKVEQVVRLIRSKGVGVYFVTQNPLDVPDTVLGQLGNRVQHALRAFTARDQKAVKAAAETMRANSGFDTEKAITELAVGEALVSFLDEKGRPNVVERAYIVPPASRIGPITPEERQSVLAGSVVAGVYEKTLDRESAYEKLKGRTAASAQAGAGADAKAGGKGSASGTTATADVSPGAKGSASGSTTGGTTGAGVPPADSGPSFGDRLKDTIGGVLVGGTGRKDSVVEAMAKSAARTIGSQIGREILRGVLGSIMGRKR